MNRFSSSFALVALLLPGALGAAPPAAKPRVAVLEFKDKVSGYSWYQAGRAAQDMLVTELVNGGKYRVVERERMEALLAEKNLSLSGDVDAKTAVQIGKMLGVEYLIAGSVTELGVSNKGVNVPSVFGRIPSVNVRSQKMEAALDARAFSTSTGEIVWASSQKDSSSDASVYVAGAGGGVEDRGKLDKILRPVVKKLASSLDEKQLPTTGLGGTADASGIVGKIAKADGGTIFVNVGAEAGVKEGDTFDVVRTGDVIKDPDTGEVLGSNETKVGRVRITAVKGPRLSQAETVSGSGFKTGDVLKSP